MRKLLLLSVLALCGCAATGPAFDEGMIPQGDKATVVVYRPDSFLFSARAFPIDINGEETCSIHKGGYFIAPVEPGKITLSAAIWDMIGTSRISTRLKSHDTQFIRIEPDSGKVAAVAVGGLIGETMAEAGSSTGGPFLFTLMEPDQAKQELRDLHREEGCK